MSAEWNGTGSSGAFLPVGVYFYKAHITYNGQSFPIRNEPGSKGALVGGVGRIVIVR